MQVPSRTLSSPALTERPRDAGWPCPTLVGSLPRPDPWKPNTSFNKLVLVLSATQVPWREKRAGSASF